LRRAAARRADPGCGRRLEGRDPRAHRRGGREGHCRRRVLQRRGGARAAVPPRGGAGRRPRARGARRRRDRRLPYHADQPRRRPTRRRRDRPGFDGRSNLMTIDVQVVQDAPQEPGEGATGGGGADEGRRSVLQSPRIERYSGLYVMGPLIVLFSSLRPGPFATLNNAKIVAAEASTTALITLGLTIALATDAFDISIGAMMRWAIVFVAWL